MQKTILEQIDQRVIALYDDFTHRHFDLPASFWRS